MKHLTREQGQTLKMDLQLILSLLYKRHEEGLFEAVGNPVRPHPPAWHARLRARLNGRGRDGSRSV